MNSSYASHRAALALLFGLVPACFGAQQDAPSSNVRRLAEAMCDAYERCSCAEFAEVRNDYLDRESCVSSLVDEIDREFDSAVDGGLSISPSCLDEIVAAFGSVSCTQTSEAWNVLGRPFKPAAYCPLFSGAQAEGESCDPIDGGRANATCEAGLFCRSTLGDAGVCASLESGACEASRSQSIACSDGEVCSGMDGTGWGGQCSPVAKVGEPCVFVYADAEEYALCGPGLVCDTSTLMCVDGPAPGEACQTGTFQPSCGEGAACNFGDDQCVALAGEGESCDAGNFLVMQCQLGLECVAGLNTCQVAAPAVCKTVDRRPFSLSGL